MARGYKDPDLKEGAVDTSGRVSLRPSRLQLVPLGALKIRKIRSLDVKNAFLQTDGLGRDVSLRAPAIWDS